jgi:hypothetical protein
MYEGTRPEGKKIRDMRFEIGTPCECGQEGCPRSQIGFFGWSELPSEALATRQGSPLPLTWARLAHKHGMQVCYGYRGSGSNASEAEVVTCWVGDVEIHHILQLKEVLKANVKAYSARALRDGRGLRLDPGSATAPVPAPQGSTGIGVTRAPAELAKLRLEFVRGSREGRDIVQLLKLTHNYWPTRMKRMQEAGGAGGGKCRYGCGLNETEYHILGGWEQPKHPMRIHSIALNRHKRAVQLILDKALTTGGYVMIHSHGYDASTDEREGNGEPSAELRQLRKLWSEYKGKHNQPDIMLFHLLTGTIVLVDMSFARDDQIVKNDEVRKVLARWPQWYDDKGQVRDASRHKKGTVGVLNEWGGVKGSKGEEVVELLTISRWPKRQSHATSPLIPWRWDAEQDEEESEESDGEGHAEQGDRRHLTETDWFWKQWESKIEIKSEEAMQACADRFNYSPTARYRNRYADILAHMVKGMKKWKQKQGRGKEICFDPSGDHRVIPLVAGLAGTPTQAMMESIEELLFSGDKNRKRTIAVVKQIQLFARDAALDIRSVWFAKE